MLYELLVVASVKSDAQPFLKNVEKAITDSGSEDLKVESLGKKILAYPIGKHTEGEYVVFTFEANGEAIVKVGAMLRLEQEAKLRYLITKVKPPKKVRARAKGKEPEVKIEAVPKVTVTTKTTTAGKAAKVSTVTKVKKVSKEKK